jgi:hypothetical protein
VDPRDWSCDQVTRSVLTPGAIDHMQVVLELTTRDRRISLSELKSLLDLKVGI